MGSEVMAEYAARIGETVRVLRCRGIEQDADGFLRLRAKDHHAGRNLAGLASVAVDVENAASAVAPGIHQNFISHSVRNEHAIAGGQRVSHRGERGIKIRMRHAATLAGPAEVARAAAVKRPGEIGIARGHDDAAELFLHAIAEQSFLASERNRRLKLAVGKMLEAFGGAGDADVFFDEIVVRLDVLVSERPILAVAVKGSRLEIPIAKSQAYTAPDVGTAAGHSNAPHPVKGLVGRRRVGFFEIVGKPFVGIFVANAEFDLNRPRLANDFRGAVPVLQFERRLMLGKIFVGLRAAGFEERDLQASLRETLAGPAAGRARTNNDDVKRMILVLGHRIKI